MKTRRLQYWALPLLCLFLIALPLRAQRNTGLISHINRTLPFDTVRVDTTCLAPLKHHTETELKSLAAEVSSMTPATLSVASTSATHAHIPTTISVDTTKTVGSIPIHSQLSPSGGLVYNVPISCVPVRNGLAPSLSISYNSQTGNNIAGYGWSIEGASMITRVPRSIYYDEAVYPVSMSGFDGLMLDGVRLLRTDTTDVFETEHGNIRVIADRESGTYSGFTVLYPNGSRAEFSPTPTKNYLAYPITKMTDALGNITTYTYATSHNRWYLSEVAYGKHTASTTALASVKLSYKERTDTISGSEGGQEIKITKLLDNIKCYNGTELVHTYTFTYRTETVSLLTQIGCDNLNPLQFYYGYSDNKTTGYDKTTATLSSYFDSSEDLVISKVKFKSGEEDDALIVYPNFNPAAISGSGNYYSAFDPTQVLLVYQELKDTYPLPTELLAESGFQTLLTADVNGRPGEELIKINAAVQNGKEQITVKTYTPQLGVVINQTSTLTLSHDSPNGSSLWPKVYLPGDYDGDGKMELFTVSMSKPLDLDLTSKCSLYSLSSGATLFSKYVFEFDIQNSIVFAADMDTDGKTDICHVTNTGTTIYSFTKSGSTYNLASQYHSDMTYTNRQISIGDVDGDGKPEIVMSPKASFDTGLEYDVVVNNHRWCPSCKKEWPLSDVCRHCNAYIGWSETCVSCDETLDGNDLTCPTHGGSVHITINEHHANGEDWLVYYPLTNTSVSYELMEIGEDDDFIMQDH